MPERILPRLLARLLPEAVARELFEPAWCDLHIAHLETRGVTRTGAARVAMDVRHLARLLALYLDCWRLAVADAPRLVRDARRRRAAADLPRPERLTVLRYHLRHAVRRLLHEPAFTVAAILTLSLGIGANVAVFTVIEAVLLRPLPYPEPEQLVVLNHRDERTGITKEFLALGDYVDLARQQAPFAAVARYGGADLTVYGDDGEPYRVHALGATASLFDVLRVRPLLGRALTPDDTRPGAPTVVLLGEELWRSRFGADRGVVGRSIRIGDETATIVGVAPRAMRYPPNADADMVFPLTTPGEVPAQRRSGWILAIGRLQPGVTVADADARLRALSRQWARDFPQSNEASAYFVKPMHDALVGDTRQALVLLLAAVAVVLLIACANVANLLLARSLARRGEMAVRVALGAGSGRLATQLLAECLVLVSTASAVGLLFAHWGARALVALVPAQVSVPGLDQVRLDGTVLVFALLLAAASTLVFGLVSLLTTRSRGATAALVTAARASVGIGTRRATSSLVVVEVAFAVVLLLGAGLILRSFAGLMAVDPGFDVERVMTMEIGLPGGRYRQIDARQAFYDRALADLRALPEVREVGAAVVMPLTGNNWTLPLVRPEQPLAAGERPPEVGWQVASGGYFRALRIPLIAGRLFDERERPGGLHSAIVSDALARRFYPDGNEVGRRVVVGKDTATIIGVVGSIRRAELRDEPRMDMYLPFETNVGGQITLFVRTSGDPVRPLAAIQRALREIEPRLVFMETRTLASVAAESVRVTRLVLWLLGIFAALALALAAVGIYGVMSYVVRQRTREIGTRIALGAQRHDIVWMVMREGAGIALLGAAIGLGVGLAAARVLGALLYSTSVADPLVLVAAPAVLVAATLAACWIPARRAAGIDPVRTLAES